MSQQPEPLLGLLDADAARTALICPDADVRLSHAELAELVDALAGKLQAAGVGPGDRVAVVLPNGVELVAILFALASLGAATVPLNPAYTEPEFRFYLDDLVPQLLLIGESAVPNARAAAGSIPIAEVVAAAPGQPVDLRAGGRTLAPAGSNGAGTPEQIALLLHTSGTTSRPKQVPLLQRNLTAQARSIAAHYQLTCDDVSFCAMPLVPRPRPDRFDPGPAGRGRHGDRASPLQPAPVLEPGGGRLGHLAVGRPHPAPDDPRSRRRCRYAPAVRALLQFRAFASADARGRGSLRRAHGRGLRHDRGHPPDRLQPAAAGGPVRGIGGDPRRRRVPDRRPRTAATSSRAPPGRSRSAAPGSPPATSTTTRRTPSRSSTAGFAPATRAASMTATCGCWGG